MEVIRVSCQNLYQRIISTWFLKKIYCLIIKVIKPQSRKYARWWKEKIIVYNANTQTTIVIIFVEFLPGFLH